MLMEAATKGDLQRYMQYRGRLQEDEAVHIIYQMLHAAYYLHARDILHRDFKLENVLIDKNEMIKLCDFGWCSAPGANDRFDICGTLEYMAPEVIRKAPHNDRVDIWAIGVLGFELVHGRSPFIDRDQQSIERNILRGGFNYEAPTSEAYKQLIIACLQPNPQVRPNAASLLQFSVFSRIRQYYYVSSANGDPRGFINSPSFASIEESYTGTPTTGPAGPFTRPSPPELAHMVNYNPQIYEVDFHGKEALNFSNIGDYFDFDMGLGGAKNAFLRMFNMQSPGPQSQRTNMPLQTTSYLGSPINPPRVITRMNSNEFLDRFGSPVVTNDRGVLRQGPGGQSSAGEQVFVNYQPQYVLPQSPMGQRGQMLQTALPSPDPRPNLMNNYRVQKAPNSFEQRGVRLVDSSGPLQIRSNQGGQSQQETRPQSSSFMGGVAGFLGIPWNSPQPQLPSPGYPPQQRGDFSLRGTGLQIRPVPRY